MTSINTFNNKTVWEGSSPLPKTIKNETEYKLLFMTIYENIKQLESVGQLSANSLVNADCLEAMKYIADKSIDMVLCDLPYG